MATGEDTIVGANLIECPVCLDSFKKPKILPCQHSICENCLSMFLESTRENNGEDLLSFPCPMCRTAIVQTDASAPTDQGAGLMQRNKELEAQNYLSRKSCKFCSVVGKSAIASIWCKQCVAAICDTCKIYHKAIGVTSSHDLLPITEVKSHAFDEHKLLDNTCLQHKGKPLEVFCTTHQQACCVVCLISQHLQCAGIRTLEDVAEEVELEDVDKEVEQTDDGINGVENYLDKLQKTVLSILREKKDNIASLEKSRDEMSQQFNSLVTQMKEKLEVSKEDFNKRLSKQCKKKVMTLQNKMSLVEKFIRENGLRTRETMSAEGTSIKKFLATEEIQNRLGNNLQQLKKTVGPEKKLKIKAEFDKYFGEIEKLLTEQIDIIVEEFDPEACFDDIGVARVLPAAIYWTKTPELSLTRGWKFTGDSSSPYSCTGAYMLDGCLAIADQPNGKIKFVSKAIDSGNSVTVPALRLCRGNQEKEVFALYSKSDAKFCVWIDKNHCVHEFKQVHKESTCIALRGSDLAVLYNLDSKLSVIEFIDAVTEQIKPDKVTFSVQKKIENMAISSMTGNIYCADGDALRCYSPDANLLFMYKPETLKSARGVALDPKDNVYVCDSGSATVHQVSSDGSRSRILLSNLEGIRCPYGIGFHPDGKQFFISSVAFDDPFSVYTF